MIVDSIHFKGHTCFKNEWSGFDNIKPINVIIGQNNSGKSHLLDLVEALCSGQLDGRGWQYRGRGKLDEDSLRQHFHGSRRKSYTETNLNGRHLDKMDLATLSAPHMTKELMESRFDWNEQIPQILERIECWNR